MNFPTSFAELEALIQRLNKDAGKNAQAIRILEMTLHTHRGRLSPNELVLYFFHPTDGTDNPTLAVEFILPSEEGLNDLFRILYSKRHIFEVVTTICPNCRDGSVPVIFKTTEHEDAIPYYVCSRCCASGVVEELAPESVIV